MTADPIFDINAPFHEMQGWVSASSPQGMLGLPNLGETGAGWLGGVSFTLAGTAAPTSLLPAPALPAVSLPPVPQPPPENDWHDNIAATIFGGRAEPMESGWDGRSLSADNIAGVALPSDDLYGQSVELYNPANGASTIAPV
ncbi:MAG: hypothetical protein ABR611_08415 [Chthoniobacterales bacterium]